LRKNNKYIRYFVNRKFAVDAVSMAIFWVIVYTPVFLYTSKSIEAALVGLGSSAILEILFGGVTVSSTIGLDEKQA
jgi:heme A synthase